jgi:radical SAM superfamily enzyme YgiQ (UPF0313 family)
LRVLLVHPPLLPVGEVTPPLGLCTLASWLSNAGHQVRVLDLDLEVKKLEHGNRRYLDLFARTMLEFSPEVVGLTSMYNNSLQAEQVIRAAKRMDPGVITVAGGSHFGALGAQSLGRIPELDYVIEGEAEPAFAALLEGAAPQEVPRLHYRVDGELRANPSRGLMDLSALPAMWIGLRDILPLERYAATIASSAGRRIVYIEAGRGCPFACTFCATAPFWEQRYRVKPVARIVDEMRYLHEEFRYDSFILVHDLLTVNSKFMSEFCDAMLAARLPVEWMANSRTDIRLRGLVPKMKAAGCWKLFYGVESASSRVQKEIDKHLKMDAVFETIEDLTDHGISATTSFVMGFPTETAEELSASIAMGARLKLMGVETVQFHRLRLFPPSRLSRAQLAGEFDAYSLKIEYPFLEIPAEDIDAIRADPAFFSGYWTPSTSAGSSEQLAQVEMFFHHLVALAPLTAAAIAQFAGPALISSFYQALADWRPLQRENLDWETGDVFGNWLELQPLLETWISRELALENWQSEILRALSTYEDQRIAFVTNHKIESPLIRGENWVAFRSELDLPRALARLQLGACLTPDLLSPITVVLARKREQQFAAYTVDAERTSDLAQLSAELAGVFT